ncbi:MAG TPA: hypothetical protein PKW75_07790, partial [candidate division Zixibacteria bacterium]|nr:hypothetical protein [candidate division Zixibacteria bacterium]
NDPTTPDGDLTMSQPSPTCPGSAPQRFTPAADRPQAVLPKVDNNTTLGARPEPQSHLGQWPVQLMLVPTHAGYFTGADLALTADCVPFAFADFHERFLKGRPLAVGCPKLDNAHVYIDKLAEIFALHNLKSMEVIVMEVPCCSGLVQIALAARDQAGVRTPIRVTTIGIRGEQLGTEEIAGR